MHFFFHVNDYVLNIFTADMAINCSHCNCFVLWLKRVTVNLSLFIKPVENDSVEGTFVKGPSHVINESLRC